jgi:hypothetical protein
MILTAPNIVAGERLFDIKHVNEDAEYHEAGESSAHAALASGRMVPLDVKTRAARRFLSHPVRLITP